MNKRKALLGTVAAFLAMGAGRKAARAIHKYVMSK